MYMEKMRGLLAVLREVRYAGIRSVNRRILRSGASRWILTALVAK